MTDAQARQLLLLDKRRRNLLEGMPNIADGDEPEDEVGSICFPKCPPNLSAAQSLSLVGGSTSSMVAVGLETVI